ncbi:hypothetical protein ACFX13_011625 [Malus domestica]
MPKRPSKALMENDNTHEESSSLGKTILEDKTVKSDGDHEEGTPMEITKGGHGWHVEPDLEHPSTGKNRALVNHKQAKLDKEWERTKEIKRMWIILAL